MKFTTITGSQYEVNTDSKQVRRLMGQKDPTTRMGTDGVWKKYSAFYPEAGPQVGQGVVIVWDHDTPALDPTEQATATKTTMTSMVVEVIP